MIDFTKTQTVVMVVTPEMAESWLRRNRNNRPIRPRHVAELAHDMRLGRWHLTHQGIGFDVSGELLDGQHRLQAIVMAGVTVPLTVTTGMAREVAGVIDTNIMRSPVDAMLLSGRQRLLEGGGGANSNAAMWRAMAGGLVAGVKVSMSHEELFQFADRHSAAGVWALGEFGKHRRVKRIHVGAVMGALARAYYHHRDQLEPMARFIEILCTGLGAMPSTPEENAVRLRNWLMDAGGVRNSNVSGEIYGKTAASLIAFLQRRSVSKLYRPEQEPFPLPAVSASPGQSDRMAFDFGRPGAGRHGAAFLA